ncbi:porin family protein [Pedobacter sp. PWIIR3]
MKKLIMMAAIVLPCLFVQAQEKQIRLGVKIGANFSVFTNDVYPFKGTTDPKFMYFKPSGRASGMGGVTADFSVRRSFSLGAELLFNSRGMAYSEENNYAYETDENGYEKQSYNFFNYNIDYLEVPVTANYHFYPRGHVKLTAYAGLAPSIAIHGKSKLKYAKGLDGDGYRASNENTSLTNVRSSNNSVLAGFQVSGLGLGATKVIPFLDLRLSYLLRSVFSGTQHGSDLDTKMFTGTFAFGVKF